MNLFKNIKLDIYKILLTVCSIFVVALGVFTLQQNNILVIDSEGLTLIENINSGIQRISKLELENSRDEGLLNELQSTAEKLYSENSNLNSKYFSENDEIQILVQEFINELILFQNAVEKFRATGDRDSLFLASENNYNVSLLIAQSIGAYISSLSNHIAKLEIYLIIDVIVMALLLLKILLDTVNELKQNKEMSKEMFIDTSTGLYNRSKCQEILKDGITPENQRERAIIVFDLNDLKKTNDGLGHRAGDDLISSFATQLKKATEVFSFEVFTGRYGGDEFVVSFNSIVEKDVELYIDEVNYLMKEFNESGKKPFKLSCAAGYAITSEETKMLTMRELFDLADASMYTNKLAMKEKKRQEMSEKGIAEPEFIDDRL